MLNQLPTCPPKPYPQVLNEFMFLFGEQEIDSLYAIKHKTGIDYIWCKTEDKPVVTLVYREGYIE